MKKHIILFSLLFLLLTLLTACEKEEIPPTQDCTNPIENYDSHPSANDMVGLLDKYTGLGLPGISLLIRDENGVWAGADGMADIDKGIEFQSCHISKIASVTKLYIGVLSMQLVEDGVFALDDPVTKWLPNKYTSKVENADKASIRELLNHTSGIYDVIDDNNFYLKVLNNPDKFWKPAELLEFIYGKKAEFPVGTEVKYSNTNLLLTAMVIEAATGRPHAELLRERILEPLSLDDTYYYWHDQLPPFVAQGYYDLYNNGTIVNMSSFNTGSGNGYGGMYSTVFDMQLFIEALLRNKTLLSPTGLSELIRITSENQANNIAFGVAIRKDFLDRAPEEFALGHRGRDLAYSADLYYFPNQDISVAYMVNYGTDGGSDLKEVFSNFREELIDMLMKH